MNNFSIENLFNNAKIKKNMDVETINNNNIDINLLNAEILAKQRKQREKEIKKIYKQQLVICLNKVKILNDRDETDIIYKVPLTYYSNSKYDSYKCLLYIKKKLRKKYFDTYILSSNKIFVSWKNYESNKSIDKIININDN